MRRTPVGVPSWALASRCVPSVPDPRAGRRGAQHQHGSDVRADPPRRAPCGQDRWPWRLPHRKGRPRGVPRTDLCGDQCDGSRSIQQVWTRGPRPKTDKPRIEARPSNDVVSPRPYARSRVFPVAGDTPELPDKTPVYTRENSGLGANVPKGGFMPVGSVPASKARAGGRVLQGLEERRWED